MNGLGLGFDNHIVESRFLSNGTYFYEIQSGMILGDLERCDSLFRTWLWTTFFACNCRYLIFNVKKFFYQFSLSFVRISQLKRIIKISFRKGGDVLNILKTDFLETKTFVFGIAEDSLINLELLL